MRLVQLLAKMELAMTIRLFVFFGHLMWATRPGGFALCGHNNVRVLNGSLQAWRSAELPMRGGEEAYPPATFTSLRQGILRLQRGC